MLDNSESHDGLDTASPVELNSGFDVEAFFQSSSKESEPTSDAPEPELEQDPEAPSEEPSEQEDGQNEDPSTDEPPVSEEPEGESQEEVDVSALEPLTYTVNGESRTFEGISVLPDGAIVDREALPKLMQRLSERDNLHERNQELYKQHRDLENLTRFKSGDKEFSGVEGVRELRTRLAQTEALATILLDYTRDPAKAEKLLAIDPETQELVANTEFQNYLRQEMRLAAMDAKNAADAELNELANYREPVAATDYTQYAPQITDHYVNELGYGSSFSQADKSILAAALPQFLRPFDPKIDDPSLKDERMVVDAGFGKIMQELAAERGKVVQNTTQVSKITQENRARMKSAAAGKPAGKHPLPPRDKKGKFRERPAKSKVTDALDNGMWPTYN